MSQPESHEESPAVVLILGVLAIFGLLYISLLALSGPVWMGVLFGTIELVVAWRVAPPAGALALRGVTALLGAVTVIWALAWPLDFLIRTPAAGRRPDATSHAASSARICR